MEDRTKQNPDWKPAKFQAYFIIGGNMMKQFRKSIYDQAFLRRQRKRLDQTFGPNRPPQPNPFLWLMA